MGLTTRANVGIQARQADPRGMPSTPMRDGYNWLRASESDRQRFVQRAADRMGTDSSELRKGLDAFYGTGQRTNK